MNSKEQTNIDFDVITKELREHIDYVEKQIHSAILHCECRQIDLGTTAEVCSNLLNNSINSLYSIINYLLNLKKLINKKDEYDRIIDTIAKLPLENIECLTDIEQRIFLAAMGREEKICKRTDKEHPGDVNLVRVCNEIKRKVKKTLWKI